MCETPPLPASSKGSAPAPRPRFALPLAPGSGSSTARSSTGSSTATCLESRCATCRAARRRDTAGRLGSPPAPEHVDVAAPDRHLLGVEVLEQRLRVAARGAQLVPHPGDRRRAVSLADLDDASGQRVERLGIEVEVAG